MKKVISLLLCVIMIVSMQPVSALADEDIILSGEEQLSLVEEAVEESAESEETAALEESEAQNEPAEPEEIELPAESEESIEADISEENDETEVPVLNSDTIIDSGTCGDNLTWTLSDEGVLTISGTGAMEDYDDYWYFAPWYEHVVTSVVIDEGVTRLGMYAFIYLDLASITIPNSLTHIYEYAFYQSHIEEIIIGAGSLYWIGTDAFRDGYIGRFVVDENNACFSNDEFGVLFNKDKTVLWTAPSSLTGSYTIPNSVTSIAAYAFYDRRGIKEVIIPDSVNSIGDFAFYESGLKSVIIPDSVTEIGERAFANCFYLTDVSLGNGITCIGDCVFEYTALTDITIPNGVTSIGIGAFCGSEIRSISIPDSVTSIGDYAFDECSGLSCVYYAGSKKEWNNIKIGLYNDPLESDSTIYFEGYDITGVNDLDSNEYALVVKINKKANDKENSEYILASGATVKADGEVYETDSSGKVVIPWPVESVTVEMDNYCSLTIPESALRGSNTVYLEKESKNGKPVIQAVYLKDKYGYEHDILHEEYQLPALSDKYYTLRAEVFWANGKESVTRLHQDGITDQFEGGITYLPLCSKFDITEGVDIVAVDEDGDSVTKTLRLAVDSALGLDGFSFNLGDSLSFVLPDSAGILAGKKMSIGIYSPVPVVIQNENGKVYVAIGYQHDEEYDDGEWTPKTWCESLEDLTESVSKAQDALTEHRLIRDAMNKLKYRRAELEGSFGVDGGVSVMGYAEGYVDAYGNLKITSSGGFITFSAEVSYTQPFVLGALPVYFEISFSNNFETQMNLYLADEIDAFTPQMTIKNETALSGGGGVGIAKVASGGIGAEGVLTNTLELDKGIDYYKLEAALKWYAKFKLGPKQFKFGDTIADAVWYEYPSSTATAAVLYSSGGNGRSGIYDTSQYTPIDLSYLENTSNSGADGEFVAAVLYSSGNDGAFVSNAYKDADPQIAYFSDGTALAVWIGYNGEVGSYDGLNLYYAYHDGGSWSEPALVDTDGTMDDMPYLTVVGEDAYLTWQDANGSITADMSLEELAPLMGISAAVFDKNNLSFVVSTLDAGGSLNTLPTLCGEDDVIYAVWMQNNAGDWFGMDGSNSILCSCYTDGEWTSTDILYSGLGPVLDLAADYNSGLQVAYSMDGDGNLNTDTDVEVFENGSAVTENEYLDSGVVYSGGELYWFGAGTLMCEGTKAQADDAYITSDRFQIVNENGVKALLYTDSDGLASVLYGVFYDGGSGLWGSPVALVADGTHIPYFHASVNSNGELSILLEKQSIVGDYTSDDPYGTAELVWYNEPLTCDLTVSDLYFDNSTYVAGSDMVLRAMVNNVGELTVDTLHVAITDSEGNVLSEKTVPETIRPGESAEIYTAFNPNEIEQGKALTLTITPANLEDVTPDDNTVEATLGWNDLSVEAIQWAMDDNGMVIIHANIVNRGYDAQTDVVVKLCADSKSGNVVQTETIAELTSFGLVGVSFDVECVDEKVYYVCVEHADSDLNYGNDYDFVVLRQSVTEDEEDVRIEGVVITTPDGTKIENNALFLYLTNFTDEEIKAAMKAGDMSEAEAMAAWNDDGSFTFSDIDAGEYKLVVYTTRDHIPYIQTVNTSETIELGSVVIAKYGDITGDDTVDAQDLVRLMNYIVGKDVAVIEITADPTGNGSTDILDIIRLVRYIAGHDVILL